MLKIRSNASTTATISVGDEPVLRMQTDGILEAAIHPTTGDRSLTAMTMRKFTDEFTYSASTNGWMKLPNGIIIQWGSRAYTPAALTKITITYPIAFPNAALNIQFGTGTNMASGQTFLDGTSATDQTVLNTNLLLANRANFQMAVTAVTNSANGRYISWIATGY